MSEEPIVIPPERLDPITLERIIEEFVTREGTDYGEGEYLLKDKVAEVLRSIQRGKVSIVYDTASESCTLLTAEKLASLRKGQ